jgi:MFS transporter, SP family, solute carrier family 2 (myo-inositol transporter), member 13
MKNSLQGTKPLYLSYLILVSGLGGMLAGIDYGIISGALLYLEKTIPMTDDQQGLMVGIYTLGGVVASLFAGVLADLTGRKRLMLTGGTMFVASILLIFISSNYTVLLFARVMMGLSGGMVCVAVPLYMAECLPANFRGRGTSAFQLFMTLGFLAASLITFYFAKVHAEQIRLAAGDMNKIFQADENAWRYIFLTACVPGILFFLAVLLVKESPRWLFRRGKIEQAQDILRLSRSEEQAELELREMRERTESSTTGAKHAQDSLLQRKYLVPFVISCVILACTQATGINSIVSYVTKIFQGAGLTEQEAAMGFTVFTAINCVMTFIGALLVDKVGRKLLLTIGTGGIIVCLACAGLLYNSFESKKINVLEYANSHLSQDGKGLKMDISEAPFVVGSDQPGQLRVAYRFEKQSQLQIASIFSNAVEVQDKTLEIKYPIKKKWDEIDGKKVERDVVEDLGKLRIEKATFTPIPSRNMGVSILIVICAFVAFFAIGPGVCVWLALTELMPTRIRSSGMGIAMFLNNGVQFLSALLFPRVVGDYGFRTMFFIWGGFTVVYFLTVVFFMPETKGKTLEEIEDHFAAKHDGSNANGR